MSNPPGLATPANLFSLPRVTWLSTSLVQRAALAAIVLVAFLLRIWDLSRLSLWLDELATVTYGRLPWSTSLGLQGAYDNHPPLYYALNKAASLVVSEVVAGRLISAVAGTLTVWVLYETVRSVASVPAGLLAALALALSPLHIWYSREARMYALVVLFVALVALMVARSWKDSRTIWPIGAAVFASLGLYTDYAAIMALVPLGLVVVWRARISWRNRWPMVAAFAVAALSYLPWMTQLVDTVESVGSDRSFLDLTRDQVFASILSVIGLGSSESFYWGAVETPVTIWPLLGVAILIALVPVAGVLTLTMPRQFPDGTALIVALLPGTFITTALISLVSPAFADRTILPASLGWAMLLGIAPLLILPCGSRLLVAGLFTGTLLLAVVTAGVIQVSGSKQDYRGFTSELTVASATGMPVIVPEGWTRTAISLYEPDLMILSPDEPVTTGAVWLAGGEFDDLEARRATLGASGYARLSSQTLDDLILELWVLPGTVLGTDVPTEVLAARAQTAADGSAWRVSGSTVIDDTVGTSTVIPVGPEPLTIQVTRPADLADPGRAVLDLAGAPHTLYVGQVAVTPVSGEQSGTIELTCHDSDGRGLLNTLAVQSAGSTDLAVAILCPSGTVGLSLAIGVEGSGVTTFDSPTLRVIQAPVPPPEDD